MKLKMTLDNVLQCRASHYHWSRESFHYIIYLFIYFNIHELTVATDVFDPIPLVITLELLVLQSLS